MTESLKKKVDQAIRFLKSINADEIELAYSGGKDSDVILELAKMAGIQYRAIYKNTTIDPPGTIEHVLSKGVEILRPKESFAKLIQKKGFPSRYRRFCCSELKEYPVCEKVIQGIRREESKRRAKRYIEPTTCRVYSKKVRVEIFMPVLEWTEKDIKEFVDEYKVKCHSLYYDENGVFHPERRLGCMCCPIASKNKRIEEFKKYPGMIKYYVRNGAIYLKNKPKGKIFKTFQGDVYAWLCKEVFTDSTYEFDLRFKGLFPVDCKEFLENYFNVKL
mgnify:CR=1 FL=1